MSKDKEKKAVAAILRDFGFRVLEIPEEPQEGRRADLQVSKDMQSFLIEVKSREDHPEFTSDLAHA